MAPRRTTWKKANLNDPMFSPSPSPLSSSDASDAPPESQPMVKADSLLSDDTGTHPTIVQSEPQSQPPMRSSVGMNSYGAQPTRQAPRLQNANKTGLGGTANQWGGFGIPSAAGGGFGGLGGAPGLGQGARPGQLSGFAQVMGGGGGQGPIDMSDFPSLSGGPRPQQNNNTATGWNSNAIRQPSAQQQPPQQQRAPSAAPSQQSIDQFDGQRSQQAQTDRSGGGDDFPPLGGQLNGDPFSQANGGSASVNSPDSQPPRLNGQQIQQLPIRESSGIQQGLQTTTQQPPPPAQNGHTPPAPSGIKKFADMTENEQWGLPGLMAAFEARRQSEHGGQVDDTLPASLRSAVIMGHDLGALGLDLDSAEPLYKTFTPFQAIGSSGSSFDFHERNTIPDFELPSAYTVTNVPHVTTRINAFSDETLFSIFYQTPRDILQELAATELNAREWRWHKILRQWLRKDDSNLTTNSGGAGAASLPLVDLTNGAPPGTLPVLVGTKGEKGVYIFFDAMNWRRERRWLELDYLELDHGRAGLGMGGMQGRLQGAVEVGGGGVGQGSSGIVGA